MLSTQRIPHGRHRRNLKRDWHYRDCAPGAERRRYLELRASGLRTNAAWYTARAEFAPTPTIAAFWRGLLAEED